MATDLHEFIRGAIERHIDTILERKGVLDGAFAMFKALAPSVQQVEDALFGYVVGRTLQLAFDAIQMHYQRIASDDEFDEIDKILKRRALEIKSKITLIANR